MSIILVKVSDMENITLGQVSAALLFIIAIIAAVQSLKKSIKAWIEAALEDGIEIHEPDSLEDYSGQFKLRIPRSLHRALAEHSQREGVSMNQYCVYLLSRNDAVYSK